MDPDTHKPILSVQILPTNKSDQFVPGQSYSPRKWKNEGNALLSSEQQLVTLVLLLISLPVHIFVSEC